MKALIPLCFLSLLLPIIKADASVVVHFNQSKPVDDIIAFNDPSGGTPAALNWISTPATPDRIVAETFTIGTDGAPIYLAESLTLKLSNTAPNFSALSAFTITFYELAGPTAHPVTGAGFLETFSGSVQATSGAGATYFTFDLGGTVELAAGKAYSFVLQWEAVEATQNLLLEYSDRNSAQGRLWYTTDPAAPTWSVLDKTAVFYVQGQAAIPEASTALLCATGTLALGVILRHRRVECVGRRRGGRK